MDNLVTLKSDKRLSELNSTNIEYCHFLVRRLSDSVRRTLKETVFPYKCKQSVILIFLVKYLISETSMDKKEENRPTDVLNP